MRRLALLLLITLIPARAWAFSSDELLATIAMPLAVAEVSDVAGVPSDGLADLVVALNQADVPPARFVEVIRYVPVVFVDEYGQPFVQYVREQTVQGVRGDALVTVLVDRLRTRYDVEPTLAFDGPATTFVVQDNYIPPTVVTRMTTVSYGDPLAFIAMPLAVAAVADITGVPQDELAYLVSTLNQANVPAVQVVEVLRYAPVALVVDNGQPFVQYVQLQTRRGLVGMELVPVIVDELRTYYPPRTEITVAAPVIRPAFVDQDFVPPLVATRVAELRVHPHGGPPGQLKKQLGRQTGGEVVLGSGPVRMPRPEPRQPAEVFHQTRGEERHGHADRGHAKHETRLQPMTSSTASTPVRVKKEHGNEHARSAPRVIPPRAASPAPPVSPPRAVSPRGKSKGHEGGERPGNHGNPGPQKGKGGGKGHGKG
jgi:hypothetical protein